MFQVWMRQVVDDFEQNLQGQLKMGTLAETLKVTPVSRHFFHRSYFLNSIVANVLTYRQ